ncbi:Phosphoserine phosphatase 1 [Meiothermus luteus]|jgi:probable phosphoglycerate mutase|uniref:Phosphoserine phosphatase 1 n=1 Tax=Meiothermus luteus TaxID=2026184 RepID=A0A399EYU0_9DEIN|nr:histidine phosphatase family protein [Meiothermus luteus]RIH87702.1 Phosphoserine phosphatase 1 [Meiothermus luteus]RMH53713.1 MAG: histidine phosphatase family protein [Deinococcota bacterium]
MKELWLLRHGETPWNAEGRFQGHYDVGLSPEGLRQAYRLAERLAAYRHSFDGLYSSDLQRAALTARPIAEALGLTPIYDRRIREIYAGELQGLLRSESELRYPEFHRAVQLDPWNTKRPGGESMADLAARVQEFLDELPEGRHLVVTHGGVIRAALKLVLHLDNGSWRRFHIQNTSITRLLYPEGTALSVGDVGHLEAWAEGLADEAVLS